MTIKIFKTIGVVCFASNVVFSIIQSNWSAAAGWLAALCFGLAYLFEEK